MKIICAPDSFKGSLDARAAANAMARGIRQVLPKAAVDCCPIGDGGEGTLDALAEAIEIELIDCAAMRLDGIGTNARIGYFNGDPCAFIEAADCIGLHLVEATNRDIMKATTFGVGELILQAIQSGARRLYVGLGGSASNDGGCGMGQALGIRFLDTDHQIISNPIGGGDLHTITAIDTTNLSPLLDETTIVALSDVTNPLVGKDGSARIFAAQKGATSTQIKELENGMQSFAAVIKRTFSSDIGDVQGAGAAGGLAAGLKTFANASIHSGIEFVIEQSDFSRRVIDCDLCLVGEGRIDGQSLAGKACLGVARIASESGVPVVALVGSRGTGAERCLDAGIDRIRVIGEGLSQNESMTRCAELLAAAAAREARRFA